MNDILSRCPMNQEYSLLRPPYRCVLGSMLMTRKIVVVLLLAVTAVWAGQNKSSVSDSCDAYSGISVPKYRIAQTFVNRDAKFTSLTVSIAPTDTNREKVVALACKLGRDYSREQVLVVWILDNHRAAKQFRFAGQYSSEATRAALRASYSFDREKNSQELTWMPDRDKSFSTIKIKLGAPPPVASN